MCEGRSVILLISYSETIRGEEYGAITVPRPFNLSLDIQGQYSKFQRIQPGTPGA